MTACLRWFAGVLCVVVLLACGGGDPPDVPVIRLTSQSGFVLAGAAWSEQLDVTNGQLRFVRTGGSLVNTGNWAFNLTNDELKAIGDRAAQISATGDADRPVALADAGQSTLDIAGTGTFYDNQFVSGKPHSFSDKVSAFASYLNQFLVARGVSRRTL